MYSFIWISFGCGNFKDKGPKCISKVPQYLELRGTIMSLEFCDPDLTAPTHDHSHRAGHDGGRAAVVTYAFGEWSRTFPCRRAHCRFTHPLLIKPHPPLYSQCDHISRFPLQLVENFRHIHNELWSHHPFLPPAPLGFPSTLPPNVMLS